jgi:hypothetical protein
VAFLTAAVGAGPFGMAFSGLILLHLFVKLFERLRPIKSSAFRFEMDSDGVAAQQEIRSTPVRSLRLLAFIDMPLHCANYEGTTHIFQTVPDVQNRSWTRKISCQNTQGVSPAF